MKWAALRLLSHGVASAVQLLLSIKSHAGLVGDLLYEGTCGGSGIKHCFSATEVPTLKAHVLLACKVALKDKLVIARILCKFHSLIFEPKLEALSCKPCRPIPSSTNPPPPYQHHPAPNSKDSHFGAEQYIGNVED